LFTLEDKQTHLTSFSAYHPKYILTFLFFLLATVSYAQEACSCKEGDQLRPRIGMHYNSGRLDSAEFYIHKLLTLQENGCQIIFQNSMAQIALAKKDFSAVRLYLETEQKLLQKNACGPDMYVRHYVSLGKLYQELNMLDSVVTTCFKGIEASQNAKDNYGLSRAYSDLAAAFAQMEQNDKAVFYYKQGMEAAKKQIKAPTQISLIQIRLCNLYLTTFEKSRNTIYADSAVTLAKLALDTASKYQELLTYLEANDALANHALLTGNYKSAISFADVIINVSPRSIHLFDRLTHDGFSKKSEALYKLKDFVAAEKIADSALVYAQAFNPQMMVSAYKKIYQSAKANNNTLKSLAAYEKMTALNDSLFTLQKNTAISELEKKYNQAQNEKKIQDLAQQKKIYILLAFAGLLALIGLIFFIRQQRLKNKQNILEAEQRLNRARINPHFFFNALSSLQSFALQENDGKAMAINLSKFSHIMRETLESTYKEYITIDQEKDFLNKYLELQKMRFPQKFTYAINIAPAIEPDDMLIPAMILQPFVENSIEHGFSGIDHAGHISIEFEKENNNLKISISDNGKGLPAIVKENNEHISRASQIIKDRIYLLNIKLKTKAAFTIENNKNEKGVTVLIKLPLLNKFNIKE
jgi:anti-sigma regulatory factor (Ser/Thr protein kinase)